MILSGKNIQTAGEELQKIHTEHLYHSIRNPKPELEASIRHLRIVRTLDPKQYALLKRQLPYVVCGIFSPALRRTEHFAYIQHFILDADHLSAKELQAEEVRRKIEADNRVVLSFLSPSQDGLKIMFRLAERCYDPGLFSLFYKAFLRSFSAQYNLEQVIDARTCDVTRACFLSADPEAYYNPDAIPIDLNAYIDTTNPAALFETKHQLDKETTHESESTEALLHEKEPEDEIMEQIKQMLGVKRAKLAKTKPAFETPPAIDHILAGLVDYVTNQGITYLSGDNIQYGKKLHFQLGKKQAEINLFHGKRGFSVVKTPKYGTSPELNDMVATLIQLYIHENT